MTDSGERKWSGTTSGTGWMHRWLIRMFKVIPLEVLYGFTGIFVIPFYLIFNRIAARSIYAYFRRHHGYGRWKSAVATYRNHYRFAQVILDRFAAYAGRRFEFEIENNDLFKALESGDSGFIMLSSHVGNYELAGYSLVSAKKKFYALIFGGEARSVMENRRKMFSGANIEMIPVDGSMSHLFAINNALADGDIVSMPADRIFGSQKSVTTSFLGKDVEFPLGAFATAVQRDVPLLAIFMMKESTRRYRLFVYPVRLDDAQSRMLDRRSRMQELARRFAATLEDVMRRYPDQWFNYYDFWNELN